MEYLKKEIDGATFERLMLSGAARLKLKVKEVNDLNVFPIPDGDTGENMYLTIKGGIDALVAESSQSLTDKASALAKGMLLNARGNSGVILSQLFFGLAEGLKGFETADLITFGRALAEGVKCGYSAVVHPVEGTILTVAREAVEHTCINISADTDWADFFKSFLKEMKKSLANTPELLAALKESGVIDSGGAGLVYIIEGMYRALVGEDFISEVAMTTTEEQKKAVDLSKFTADSVMEFGYCTELMLQLQNSKTDVEKFSTDTIIEFLNTIGDSIVAFKIGSIIKIHVHTMTPWKVLEFCQNYGEYLTVKIENMTLQHNESSHNDEEDGINIKVKKARKKFATITVASGNGLIETFKEMGVDYVVQGGQTNNPSSEDFLNAFDEVNADYVFVLPNNKNIILTAKQAAQMYDGSDVRVVESRNVGQGYASLSMLDYSSDDAEIIEQNLNENMQDVVTGHVSVAVRTTTVNGVDVKEGDYIGFTDKTMLVSESDKMKTATKLVERLGLNEKEFLIAVYGSALSDEEKLQFSTHIEEKYPSVELYSIDGGNEIYDFIFIIE